VKRRITCIECPKGCSLSVDIENCRVVKIDRNECPKGEKYAISEVENPVRVLTATVLTRGLSLNMIPVKTDSPIPKGRISDAMKEIRKTEIAGDVNIGDIIIEDLLGLGVNLIATRGAKR